MNISLSEITAHQLHDASELFLDEKLDEYIHLGIKNQLLSVQWLANKLDMSERHLLRLFKKHRKVTCHKYLQDVKLNAAVEILTAKPTVSIKDLATKLLFSDAKYFSKIFKQKFGMNPSEFKLKSTKN